jgi:PHD/YefM family antitoxin component YafN of YafNO toxin-antitoxin module
MESDLSSVKNDGHRKMPPPGDVAGVIHIAQPGQLAQEFITVGKSFEEALGRCVIRDDDQKNAIIIYKAQLEMFSMIEEIKDLTNWLNAASAVGGFNRSLSAMVGTNIFVAEGAGIKLSKENQKALMELQRQRAMGRQGENEQEKQQ